MIARVRKQIQKEIMGILPSCGWNNGYLDAMEALEHRGGIGMLEGDYSGDRLVAVEVFGRM